MCVKRTKRIFSQTKMKFWKRKFVLFVKASQKHTTAEIDSCCKIVNFLFSSTKKHLRKTLHSKIYNFSPGCVSLFWFCKSTASLLQLTGEWPTVLYNVYISKFVLFLFWAFLNVDNLVFAADFYLDVLTMLQLKKICFERLRLSNTGLKAYRYSLNCLTILKMLGHSETFIN